MSQENVEIIRRGWEHWVATGEIRAHADFVWDVSNLHWPGQQIYPGVEGAMQFNAEWADAWDDWEVEVEDYIDAGQRVVVIVNQRGRSKATGVPVDMRFAQVWTLRDGQGIRMQMYASPEEAIKAVGLRSSRQACNYSSSPWSAPPVQSGFGPTRLTSSEQTCDNKHKPV